MAPVLRGAAARLINRNRLGRDVFARGMPEMVIVDKKSEYHASLYDLLTAYAQQRQRCADGKCRQLELTLDPNRCWFPCPKPRWA